MLHVAHATEIFLTGWSALLIPTRNSDSAMKRLMQRFLWMVLRSLCNPRKKQNVKMQISKHTSDSKIPTHVMTSRSRSCILSAFCRKRGKLQFIIFHLKSTLSRHYKTWNPKNNPVTTPVAVAWHITKQVLPCLTRSPSRGSALSAVGVSPCCTGVLAPSISVPQCGGPSNVQQSSAMMDLLLKPICGVFHKGLPNYANHDPFKKNSHLPKGELWCHTNTEPICEKEFGLDKTGRQNKKVLIPHTAAQ